MWPGEVLVILTASTTNTQQTHLECAPCVSWKLVNGFRFRKSTSCKVCGIGKRIWDRDTDTFLSCCLYTSLVLESYRYCTWIWCTSHTVLYAPHPCYFCIPRLVSKWILLFVGLNHEPSLWYIVYIVLLRLGVLQIMNVQNLCHRISARMFRSTESRFHSMLSIHRFWIRIFLKSREIMLTRQATDKKVTTWI